MIHYSSRIKTSEEIQKARERVNSLPFILEEKRNRRASRYWVLFLISKKEKEKQYEKAETE